MSMASGLRGAALLVGLMAPLPVGFLAPLPAAAQALPNEQGAKEIAEAVRAWLGRQLGTAVDMAALTLRVLPEGDGYRLELPFGGSYFDGNVVLGEGIGAATVQPLEGGRWAIVNATLPPRLRAEMKNIASGAPSVMTMAIENQQTTGTYDPTLTTASTFTTTVTGYSTEVQSAAGPQSSRIGKVVGRSEWLPSGPGRVTIQGDSTVEDYASVSPLPDGAQARVTIGRMGGATRIENFDIDGLGGLLRTAFEIGAAAKAEANAGRKGAQPDDKALATRLLGQLFSMLDGLETDYTYDNIRVEAGPLATGSLRRFAFGLSTGAPDGRMAVKLRLGMEGLESPLIPPGPWTEFVPHKLTLTPRIGGVPKEAVMALLRRAIETEGKGIDADAMALIADHPVSLGIEDLLIDLGPLRLKGEGSLEVASMDDATGEAELRATGLDALIRRANQVPELKMAAPVLIFLKGIGKQQGNETVWHITYADQKMMVNDTDLSDLMPSK